MAKILITETVADIGPKLLTEAGHQVVFANRDMDIIREELLKKDIELVRDLFWILSTSHHCRSRTKSMAWPALWNAVLAARKRRRNS